MVTYESRPRGLRAGLSPSISVDQRNATAHRAPPSARAPRSTPICAFYARQPGRVRSVARRPHPSTRRPSARSRRPRGTVTTMTNPGLRPALLWHSPALPTLGMASFSFNKPPVPCPRAPGSGRWRSSPPDRRSLSSWIFRSASAALSTLAWVISRWTALPRRSRRVRRSALRLAGAAGLGAHGRPLRPRRTGDRPARG